MEDRRPDQPFQLSGNAKVMTGSHLGSTHGHVNHVHQYPSVRAKARTVAHMKTLQTASRHPRGPNEAPRGPQTAPKRHQTCIQGAPERPPKRPQEAALRTLAHDPKHGGGVGRRPFGKGTPPKPSLFLALVPAVTPCPWLSAPVVAADRMSATACVQWDGGKELTEGPDFRRQAQDCPKSFKKP